MRWRRKLDDEQREVLWRSASHLNQQVARAYFDGDLESALACSDRAIRDAETLLRRDRSNAEVATAALAELLRDRAELHWAVFRSAERTAGRGHDAQPHARAGIADGERAIELYGATVDDADPFPMWAPSVRLLLADLCAWAGLPAQARRHGDLAVAAYRGGADGREEFALHLAHALMRYASTLADLDPAMSVELRRESVALVRSHARVGDWLWRERHEVGTTWASPAIHLDDWSRELVDVARRPVMGVVLTPGPEVGAFWASNPGWWSFSASAYDLAAALGPPRPDVARDALLALQDATEGFAAMVRTSSDMSSWLQVVLDKRRVKVCVHALVGWLGTIDGEQLAASYDRMLADLVSEPDTDWHAAFATLREPLLRHLDELGSPQAP